MVRIPAFLPRIPALLLVLFAVQLAFTPIGAQAAAIFSGSASVSITLTGIENLTTPGGSVDVEILGGVSDLDPFVGGPPEPEIILEGTGTGSATAVISPTLSPPDFDDPTVLGIGDGISIFVSGSGDAGSAGYADVLIAAFGAITADNFSLTDTVEIFFDLVVDMSTSASIGDPFLEDALGHAEVAAYSCSCFLDYFAHIDADALFGEFDPPVSDSLSFSLIVGPGSYEVIEVYAEAGGFAEKIPAPGGLATFAAGIALAVWRQRRLRLPG